MNGNVYANENGKHNFRQKLIYFVSRLFNIAPSQWSRVSECWFLTFFFKIGSAVGWTVLTAAFVSRYGIGFLPVLFIFNALFLTLSTFFFERFIMRIKREVLMILMILIGAICLFFGAVLYDKAPLAFFALVIIAESVFFAQFDVFLPILVGDRFTPLESQRTFPFIESAETIGGMIGGALVGIFASKFHIQWFFYIWLFFLACVILVFIITSYVRTNLPPLPFRYTASVKHEKTADQIKVVINSIKKIPFLKGLVVIVLLQWIFMNVLEFQYTKSLEQSVTKKREATIALVDKNMFKVDTLSPVVGPIKIPEKIERRALTVDQQAQLTQKLGAMKGIFYFAAMMVQIFLASRLITLLGIVGSLLLHPIVMLISLLGMFLKFGFLSSAIAKLNFEVTNVVHGNAYFSSHYALPKKIRDQATEFLEGVVRPLGTIAGMLFIFLLQISFSGRDLSMWIHAGMFTLMGIILICTMRLQHKYTKISRDQLFSDIPYPEKLEALEVLAQKGHQNAPKILVEKLLSKNGSLGKNEYTAVRIKLISVLGKYRNYQTLPELLEALHDSDPDVRLEAAHALMNFHDIGDKFYSQTFSRYRMIETMKEIFCKEKSATVRRAIIQLFSLLRQPDIAPFLLQLLKDENCQVRADVVYTLGLFRDPNVAFYILPYCSDSDPFVRSNAIIALWQFPQYLAMLENELDKMLQSQEIDVLKAGIYAIGEIGAPHRRTILFEFLDNSNAEIQLEAAFALTKCGEPGGFNLILDHFLSIPIEKFESLRRFFKRLKPKAKNMTQTLIANFVSQQLNNLMSSEKNAKLAVDKIDENILERLRRLYRLLDHHDELYTIESILKQRASAQSI